MSSFIADVELLLQSTTDRAVFEPRWSRVALWCFLECQGTALILLVKTVMSNVDCIA
jgi:hypothetical protein